MAVAKELWTADELGARPQPAADGIDGIDGYQHFSTRGLRTLQRIELWEQHNAQALVGLACRSINDAPLDASEDNLQLGHLRFAHVAANAHVVERSPKHIATTSTDGVALYFSLFGEAFFYHNDGVHLQRPGTLLVCDVNQPFLRGFAHGLQEYVLTVPRPVFEEITEQRLPTVPLTRSFADIPGGDVHAAALARLVRRTLAYPDQETIVATEQSALELLRALLCVDDAHTFVAHRRAALAYIDRNLRDPTISVSRVAQAIGVSERHLARAFRETGTGVARTILQKRLELARRILASPGSPAVHDVALCCGFVSPAHFARVFRDRYDRTPGETRAAAQAVGAV